MDDLRKHLLALGVDECGQDIVEYALVAAVVALASIAAVQRITTGLITVFGAVGTRLSSAI